MTTLYLLRHAKSSWDQPGLADRERPLAPRGRRAARRMAEHLSAEGARPDVVLCSTAVRARETLEIVLPALGEAEVLVEEALYATDADDLLDRIRSLPDGTSAAMVVGHNPTLQDLALDLASGGRDLRRLREKLPTGALVTLAFEGPCRELGPGRAMLRALVAPRDLR
ncbi:MAG TPA: histidine phosphatase family protein [Actinomycetota bacterium]|nr:histidine phosphatase family protein [Actinomycetota bacterium]